MTEITAEQMDAARSPRGGWRKRTLAEWGVPWPPPRGWRKTILAFGIPYRADLNEWRDGDIPAPAITEDQLQHMMDESSPQLIDGDPFECEGQLDIDPAQLLRKVVSAVISHDQGHILYDFPEVLAFFGSRIPPRGEVEHLSNLDERMFEAAAKWPNRKKEAAQ